MVDISFGCATRMNTFDFICHLIMLMVSFRQHMAVVAVSSSKFFVKTDVNSTCGEKETFRTATELNCAFRCIKKANNKCIGFVHKSANAQCEICFSCLTSFNQSKQLVSGAAQFAGTGHDITAELAAGKRSIYLLKV